MFSNRQSVRIRPGEMLPIRELVTILSERIQVPDSSRLVHLQFRRFGGCPVCDLHLHSMARRREVVAAASIREVVVFHSPVARLRPYVTEMPFAVVADPEKRLYAEFGVEAASRALLDPRAWGAIVRGVVRSSVEVLRGKAPMPPLNPDGGRFGLPAEFLIAPDGRVVDCKYGVHAYDQWSVDEVLRRARSN